MKWFKLNTDKVWSLCLLLLSYDLVIMVSMAMVYICFWIYVFPDWIRKHRIEIHCTELIVFQMAVILHTYHGQLETTVLCCLEFQIQFFFCT